jgi:hypothetical protein
MKCLFRSDVPDDSEGEFLDSDSDVPTASSHKQFQLPTIVPVGRVAQSV